MEVPATASWHSACHKGETSSASDLSPTPPSDDKYKYRPSISILYSKRILKHTPKPFPVIWKHTEAYGSVRSAPAPYTTALVKLPGSVRSANITPELGGGGSKEDCWGVGGCVLGKPYLN